MKTDAHKYIITGAASAIAAVVAVLPFNEESQWRHAWVISVYDGDTFSAVVDLGFEMQTTQHFRVLHVDTPELHVSGMEGLNPAGVKARDFTNSQIFEKEILLRETKREKFGRYLAEVRTPDGKDLAKELVRRKLGVPYEGGRRGEDP